MTAATGRPLYASARARGSRGNGHSGSQGPGVTSSPPPPLHQSCGGWACGAGRGNVGGGSWGRQRAGGEERQHLSLGRCTGEHPTQRGAVPLCRAPATLAKETHPWGAGAVVSQLGVALDQLPSEAQQVGAEKDVSGSLSALLEIFQNAQDGELWGETSLTEEGRSVISLFLPGPGGLAHLCVGHTLSAFTVISPALDSLTQSKSQSPYEAPRPCVTCPLMPRASFTACSLAPPPWPQRHLILRPSLISKFKCDGKMERPDHCTALHRPARRDLTQVSRELLRPWCGGCGVGAAVWGLQCGGREGAGRPFWGDRSSARSDEFSLDWVMTVEAGTEAICS